MFKYEGNGFALKYADMIISGHAPSTVLYICGPSGSGKTALIKYIESGVFYNHPEKEMFYLSLANESLFWSHSPNEISLKCDECDVIFLDDIDTIEPDDSYTIDSVLHIIDRLHFAHKKLVLTGKKPYRSLPEKLAKRLEWEASATLAMPTEEDCKNALWETVSNAGLCDDNELKTIIPEIVKAEGNNIGNALSTLRRITVRAELTGNKLTAKFADSVIYEGADIEFIS